MIVKENKDLGYINWWEFAPTGDTFIVKHTPDISKKETESGIIFETRVSVVQDRPTSGVVVAIGPESKYSIGDFVYFEPNAGMDLAMIRQKDDEKYLLLYNKAIIGKRVKDTRGKNGRN